MNLSQVSRTAILTLICRAVEAEKNKSVFNDPMAVLSLDRLMSIASEEEKRWIISKKRMYAGIQRRHAAAGARRAKTFDDVANRYIAGNPYCTVINLACGFDTRFWRIENEKCCYIEIDLPEVIQLKKEILQDHLTYEMMGCSVLDTAWIDTVTTNGNAGFLLLAEGLFMWFPKQEVTRILKDIGDRFCRSQLVMDMVPEIWTKGILKYLMYLEARIDWGLDVSWVFGLQDPHDLEVYGADLKVIEVAKSSAGPLIILSINAADG